MKEILTLEIIVLDTGEGFSVNCNGREMAIFDYEVDVMYLPLPCWALETIRDAADLHLRGVISGDHS